MYVHETGAGSLPVQRSVVSIAGRTMKSAEFFVTVERCVVRMKHNANIPGAEVGTASYFLGRMGGFVFWY